VAPKGTAVTVDGRALTLTNLDKVLYPETGFTKGQVIDYYARIAPAMVPHLAGRALTFKRFPNGVDKAGFFEKNCPGHRPDWVPVSVGPGSPPPQSCRVEEPAALVWAGNQAAIEIHAPMALADDLALPRMVVFDFDPGPPAAIRECAAVALAVREVLAAVGLDGWCKTSGSKGLQLYLPVNGALTHEHASSFALAVGQVLERQMPDRVLTVMTKNLRGGKVFVDWSQNSFHKTTIGVYSLRARPHPTVSTPVTWDEIAAAADGDADLVFQAADVLARVDQLGDLFAPTLTTQQALPAPQR
jgi:bifunctional non-homologous end joining protein LigD